MGKQEWLEAGEEVVDSWAVFLGEDGPMSAKITGRLYVTDKRVCFKAGIQLESNAAAAISNRIRAFSTFDTLLSIPFDQIASVRVSRNYIILKSLHITNKGGAELIFRFGAMSPNSALKAISDRIK